MALKEYEALRAEQWKLDESLFGEVNRVETLQLTLLWLQTRLDARRTDGLTSGNQRMDWLTGAVSPMFAHAAFRLEMLVGNTSLCEIDPIGTLIVTDDEPSAAWFSAYRRWVRMHKYATLREHMEKLQMGEAYHRMVWHELGPVLRDLAGLAVTCRANPHYSLTSYRLLTNASLLLALSMYFCDEKRDWNNEITAAYAFDTLHTKFTAYAAR